MGGPYIGGARWLGVRVSDLLAKAGVQPGADMVLSRSTGYTASTPLQALTDDRDAMIAIGMNGQPLPPEHGFRPDCSRPACTATWAPPSGSPS